MGPVGKTALTMIVSTVLGRCQPPPSCFNQGFHHDQPFDLSQAVYKFKATSIGDASWLA